MATSVRRSSDHEVATAMISLAGVRPISAMASVSVGATSANSHTIASEASRRCLVLVLGGANGDIRITVNETADANDWPLIIDAYYSVQVEEGDTINVYNTTAGAITDYFLELY